jgi:phage virion morphogenesis protein
MAGTAISIVSKIDDREIMREFQRLGKKAGSLHPCLKNIGEYLVESTEARFTKQVDPAGVKWAALKQATLDRKKHTKILTESSGLRDSVIYAVRNQGLRVGTNKIYAATHQFGIDKDIAIPAHKRLVKVAFKKELKFPVWAAVKAHSVNPKIPARPFLGFSSDDRQEIMEITRDFINR